MFLNTRTSGDDGDDSNNSDVNGRVSGVRVVSGDMHGSDSGRVDWDAAASGAHVAEREEIHGEESDMRCDLNACGGYDSGTCDGGSSTTASEVSERVATRSGGHRRGKRRGPGTPSVRRARAAEARVTLGATVNDDDE